MDFRVFSLVTTLGAFAWCWILARFSMHVFASHQGADLMQNPEQMVALIKHESLPLIGGIVVLCSLYIVAMWLSAPQRAKR